MPHRSFLAVSIIWIVAVLGFTLAVKLCLLLPTVLGVIATAVLVLIWSAVIVFFVPLFSDGR